MTAMSTDFSIRPVGAPAPAPVVRPLPEAAHQAVATELPAAKAVGASDAVQTPRNDPIALRDRQSHQAVFDRDAAAMVFQVVDNNTDSVIRQVPDEAQLRRRAYFRLLDQSSELSRRPAHPNWPERPAAVAPPSAEPAPRSPVDWTTQARCERRLEQQRWTFKTSVGMHG